MVLRWGSAGNKKPGAVAGWCWVIDAYKRVQSVGLSAQTLKHQQLVVVRRPGQRCSCSFIPLHHSHLAFLILDGHDQED